MIIAIRIDYVDRGSNNLISQYSERFVAEDGDDLLASEEIKIDLDSDVCIWLNLLCDCRIKNASVTLTEKDGDSVDHRRLLYAAFRIVDVDTYLSADHLNARVDVFIKEESKCV